ncbi:hypothetical protein Goshw_025098 [Gossypium schwendimanii]|uniref:Retrotransposon gag domain-containing protein n=1 Tax=Gossypium schwendimanii TaxID=34291 RepID=A0A7J9LR70_GOSSC|nr:hypothetical protein [Gossypium schwendimanii]
MGNRVSSVALNYKYVLKLKEFMGTRFAYNMDNLLWRIEHYFHGKDIVEMRVRSSDKRHSEIKTWEEFQHELKGQFYPKFAEEEALVKLRWLTQRHTVGEYVQEYKELMLQILDMTKIEALLAFKNGLKSWVRQELEREGVQELLKAMMIAETVVKLSLGKDMLESSKKSTIKGDNASDNEPKKLGLSKGKVEAKKAKRSKKKRVKWLLCRGASTQGGGEFVIGLMGKVAMKIVKLGPMKLNLSKATELAESSVRLSPIEEVSCASDSEEKVAMQTLKVESMRLTSIDTLEELTPLGKVGCASNFGKVVMQVGQLTQLNVTCKVHFEHFGSVLHSNLLTW